jgi:hypothetical protein
MALIRSLVMLVIQASIFNSFKTYVLIYSLMVIIFAKQFFVSLIIIDVTLMMVRNLKKYLKYIQKVIKFSLMIIVRGAFDGTK